MLAIHYSAPFILCPSEVKKSNINIPAPFFSSTPCWDYFIELRVNSSLLRDDVQYLFWDMQQPILGLDWGQVTQVLDRTWSWVVRIFTIWNPGKIWEVDGGRIIKTSPTARWMGPESESVRWSWKNLQWNSQMETRDISEVDAKQKVEGRDLRHLMNHLRSCRGIWAKETSLKIL